jgi:nucleoside-diphosphate-sugar epimerase
VSDSCLVTGAGGFIGYQLANALAAEGRRVVGVDLHYPDPRGALGPPRFSPLIADIRDAAVMRQALHGVAVVFHLASSHLRVSLPDSEYWDVNVHCLLPLLRLAREAGVSRFVHTSSVAVYGDVGATPANEETPPRPQSIYGETKLAGEKVVIDFGQHQPFEVVVLRPSWVYGPGCARTAKICKALRARRFVMVGAGGNLRHPLYIDDMIEAFRLASTRSGISGATLVIAGERAVTTRELIASFCEAFDLPRPSVRIPYAAAVAMAVVAESVCRVVNVEPPISRRTLEFFDTSNAFDIARAHEKLGFAPRYSLQAGLNASRHWLESGLVPQGTAKRTHGRHSA